MHVAEWEGARAGLLHLVPKRQGTVKISPLIVAPDYHGRGIGTALLRYAESYTAERGARALYCTAAQENEAAMSFFLTHGFIRAGSSHSHYKVGITETMLYKPLDAARVDSFDRAHISVLPFAEQYRAEVARMLLEALPTDFDGIDASWVEALFDGYRRRETHDVNSKYKLIFLAVDSANQVVGVAGATPKKGEPIKLMPLVAASDAAFFALASDVPQRLASYGRRVYAHIVPTVRQVRFLQKAGWRLDGVLPEAYRSELLTQQWSLRTERLSEDHMKIRLKQKYLTMIRTGAKTLEVRVGYDHIRSIRAGDKLEFVSYGDHLVTRVRAIRSYASFTSMLASEDYRRVVPDLSKDDVGALLREIYPSEKEDLGVFVLEVSPTH